jgi:diguanylate cyclase (GGDEF)-like protein
VPHLTVSIGVAVFRNNDAAEDLIRRADRLLYLAKAQGKNRVCSGSESAKIERPFFRQSSGEPA